MSNTAVFGTYGNVSGAEQAFADMKASGFRNAHISVLLPENVGTKDLAFVKGTKAPEGTASGAASGAVIGGHLAGCSESGRWPSLALDRSSPQAQSWQPWAALA